MGKIQLLGGANSKHSVVAVVWQAAPPIGIHPICQAIEINGMGLLHGQQCILVV